MRIAQVWGKGIGPVLLGEASTILAEKLRARGTALAYEFNGRWLFASDEEEAQLRRQNVDVKRVCVATQEQVANERRRA